MRYSTEPRHQLFIKGYGVLSFAKNISKNVSKYLSGKYSQKLLDHAKKSATNIPKAFSKIAILKTAKAIFDLIFNKIVDEISWNASQSNPEAALQIDEKSIEIPEEKYISP